MTFPRWILAAAVIAAAGVPASPAMATAPGDLDTSFSGDGKQTTDFGGSDLAAAVAVQADGRFSVNNLPPGRYWALARSEADSDPQSEVTLRDFEEGDTRLKIRRAAEADKNEVELKPCQNVIDYQLPFKLSSVKN